MAVYGDPLFSQRNFAGRDLVVYNLPMEKAVHDAYARGRPPVWMADVSGGRPLLSNPNAGALYPLRAALALVPFPLAMRIFPLFHWALAGIGTILLCRSIGATAAAAWIAAVTYVFSGVVVSESFFPHLMPGMALLPWILWGIERPAVPFARLLILTVLFGMEILAGDVFQIALALGSSILWILLETRREEQARRFATLSLAALLGALAAAPQILATALWIPQTRRAVTGFPLKDALLYSISPFRLLEFFVPYPFGSTSSLDPTRLWTRAVFHQKTGGLFATLYAGAFGAVAAVGCLRQRARGARFGRALLVAALAASVLPSLLPARWGDLRSPLALRNPEKFAIALVFALALLSALSFDEFRRSRIKPRWTLFIAGILCLMAAAAWLLPSAVGRFAMGLVGDGSGPGGAGRELAGAFAEAGLLWMAAVLALETLCVQGHYGLALCVTLLTLSPIVANRRIAQTIPEYQIFAPTGFARYQKKMDPSGAYRAIGESIYLPPSRFEAYYSRADVLYTDFPRRTWYEFTPALWHRGLIFNMDFDVGDLSRLESLRRVAKIAAGYSESRNFFGSLALRWGARFRSQKPLSGYRPIGGDALQIFDEHERAFPDVRLAEAWSEEESSEAALAVLPRLGAGEIVIETRSQRRGAARPGILRMAERSPERLGLLTDCPDPAWLFVLRGFWTYRTVLVDGRWAEVFPAQLAFSAVSVPAGRHRIEWKEDIPGWRVSRLGPVLSALAMLLVWRRSRRPPGSIRESV